MQKGGEEEEKTEASEPQKQNERQTGQRQRESGS